MIKEIASRKVNVVIFLLGLCLIFISGLRTIGIDRDSLTYVLALNETGIDFLSKEPMFFFIKEINKIIFNGNEQIFFLLFAILGVSIKLIAIRKLSLLPILSLYAYICLYFILHEMTQIRVGVASAIFLLAIPDILNKNIKLYIIKTIFATTFHYSAFFMIFLYLTNHEKINKKLFLVLPLIGFLMAMHPNIVLQAVTSISNILPSFLEIKVSTYANLLDDDDYNQINIFNFFYLSLVAIYYFSLFFAEKFKSKYDIILIKIFAIQIFMFYAFSSIPTIAFRISEFLGVILIILVPHIILIFRQHWIPLTPIIIWLGTYFWAITIMRILNIEAL